MTAPRIVAGMLLAAACGSSQGCLQTLVGAMVAPEAVAMQGASGAVDAVAAAAVGPDDLATLSDTSSTARDLNRILMDHPDAVNRPELEALRNELDQSNQATASDREGSAAEEAVRRAEADRRVVMTEPASDDPAKSDQLVIASPATASRRAPPRPQPYPDPVHFDPWQPFQYQMALGPVRLEE
ncbi:MAG: hypothetical protein H0W83_10970 [Planctomycetes bacterium]|nr:hypothetical protein [Planctomycetota bacterium]